MPNKTYDGRVMSTEPYAIGERPGGNYIPSIPLLSGKEAWDSIAGHYHADMLPYGDGSGPRDMDDPREKKAVGEWAPTVDAITSGVKSVAEPLRQGWNKAHLQETAGQIIPHLQKGVEGLLPAAKSLGGTISGAGQVGADMLGYGPEYQQLPEWQRIAAPIGLAAGGALSARALYNMMGRGDEEEEEKRGAAPIPPLPKPQPAAQPPAPSGGGAPRPFGPAAVPSPPPLSRVTPVTSRPAPPVSVAFGDKPATPQLNAAQGYWDAPQPPAALQGAYEARPHGLQPEDIMRGSLPPLRASATPEQQQAHAAYSQEFNDYLGNRQLWEDKWKAQGPEGAKAYHKAYQDFVNKGPQQPIDDATLGGLGYKGQDAQYEGGFLGMGQTQTQPAQTPQEQFAQTKATRDQRFQQQGPAQWNREQAWNDAFGPGVNEADVKDFAAGRFTPQQLSQAAQDPAFAKTLDAHLGAIGNGVNPQLRAQVQGEAAAAGQQLPPERIDQIARARAHQQAAGAALQSHFGDRYAAFQLMDKGLGQFGEGADTSSAHNIPGAQLFAQAQGGKNLADPEMRARWESQGKLTKGDLPFQRLREMTGQSQNSQQRQNAAANEQFDNQSTLGVPTQRLLGATTQHLNPDEMYKQYIAEGLSPDDALQRSLKDRRNLMDTSGVGGRMLRAAPHLGTGMARTMAGAMATPAMLWGEANEYLHPTGEQGARARGWARDLVSGVADPFEAATGFDVGGDNGIASRSEDSYLSEFARHGASMNQAARDPQQFGAQLAQEKGVLDDQRAQFPNMPAALAASKQNPALADTLREHGQLARRDRTGARAADEGMVGEFTGAGLGKELGGRMLGSSFMAAPAAAKWLAGGQMLGGGSLGNMATTMGGFSAAAPGFEALQTGLDKTPLGAGLGTIGQYQQAGGQRIRELTQAQPPTEAELAGMTPQQQEARIQQFKNEQSSWKNKIVGGLGETAAAGLENIPEAAALFGGGKALSKIPGLAGAGKQLATLGTQSPGMGLQQGGMMGAVNAMTGGPATTPSAAADLQRRMGRPLYGFEQSLFGSVPKSTPETRAGTAPPPEPNNPNLGTAPKEQAGLSEHSAKFVNQDAFAKADPETQAKVVGGIKNTEQRFADKKQKAQGQQALQDLQSDKPTPTANAAKTNLKDQTGWSWDQTQQAYDKMDTGSKFLMWAGLGLGAVSAMNNMMSDEGGGIMGWITSLLGLVMAGGAAAHGGMFGPEAQQGMQGLSTKFDVGRRYLSGESPEQIAKAYDPQQMAEHVLPMAISSGAISPEQQKKLDQAIAAQGSWGESASSFFGGPTVAKGLAAEGFKDPTAQKNLLEGWRRYRQRNQVKS